MPTDYVDSVTDILKKDPVLELMNHRVYFNAEYVSPLLAVRVTLRDPISNRSFSRVIYSGDVVEGNEDVLKLIVERIVVEFLISVREHQWTRQ